MSMQAHDDMLPLSRERMVEPPWQPAASLPDQERRALWESDTPAIGRDPYVLTRPLGPIVVACAWLALYAIAAIQPVIAWLLSFFQHLE